MSDFPVTTAQLTGMFLQAIFGGVLLVTTGFCLHVLFTYRGRLRRSGEVNWVMVLATVAGFTLGWLDLSLGFYHNIKAFVLYKGPGGPTAEFSNISEWINVTKSVSLLLQALLGDALLVYRCWIVWNKTFLPITLSSMLWLGACSVAIYIIYLMGTISNHVLINAKELQPTGLAFWALSITLNILTTALLVYRIWRVDSDNKRNRIISGHGRSSSLGQVIRYVIESGLLYTLMSLITFITVVTGTNGIYPAGDAEIMIIPIAFNLIIIRTSKIGGGAETSTFVASNHSNPSGTVPLQFVPRTRDADSASATKTDGIHVTMTQNSVNDYKLDKDSV